MKRRAQPWLGTLVDITIADPLDDASLSPCFARAFAAVARVHALMSFHDPDSDVSRINRAMPGQSVTVDADTWRVLDTALQLSHASGNLFNIGCAPRLVQWGYLPAPAGTAPDFIPAPVPLVLETGCRIIKTAPAWIHLAGIAKGYAVDLALAALQECGIESACVNAGGDLRVIGAHPYPVAIRHPQQPTAAGRHLQLHNEALATSGSYFSHRIIDGDDYSALLDGVSGNPLVDCGSASVRAPSCMLADGLTKVVLASGNPGHPALQQFGATAFMLGSMFLKAQ